MNIFAILMIVISLTGSVSMVALYRALTGDHFAWIPFGLTLFMVVSLSYIMYSLKESKNDYIKKK